MLSLPDTMDVQCFLLFLDHRKQYKPGLTAGSDCKLPPRMLTKRATPCRAMQDTENTQKVKPSLTLTLKPSLHKI